MCLSGIGGMMRNSPVGQLQKAIGLPNPILDTISPQKDSPSPQQKAAAASTLKSPPSLLSLDR